MKLRNFERQSFSVLFSIIFFAAALAAQTTEFTYQGKLSDSGTPSATYDFEFRLCDSPAVDCTVPLATQQIAGVPVTNGVFTVRLNFDAVVFDGSNRWLEIAVKRPVQADYTTLDPRQPLTSAPYSIRSLNTGIADNATLFGGLTTGDFVQNTTTQQTGNFNLSGDGTLGGTLLAGQVGIGGAPQPAITLDVTGNSAFRTANGLLQIGSPNGETGMSITNTASSSRADLRFSGSTLKLIASAGTGPPSENNGLIINTAGNVGIGKNPTTKLDIAGNIFTSGFLSVGNGAGITGSLSVSNGIGVSNGLSVNSGNLFVAGATTLNNGITLAGDANVSGKITTNSLRVNSGGFSFQTIGGNYGQDICRDTTFGTLGQCGLSSRRFKSDVRTFSGGLSLINQLRPVTFNWKYNGQPDFGFIAEEVFEIYPPLTTTSDAGELEGVKYKMFSVVLVDAVKQQQKEIEQQQKQIGRQQRQIDALMQFVCSQNPQVEICREQ